MSVKSVCRRVGVTPHMLEVLESIGRGENPRDKAVTVSQRRSLQLALTALWKGSHLGSDMPCLIRDSRDHAPQLTVAGRELLRVVAEEREIEALRAKQEASR